jgi:hypothetical protein
LQLDSSYRLKREAIRSPLTNMMLLRCSGGQSRLSSSRVFVALELKKKAHRKMGLLFEA